MTKSELKPGYLVELKNGDLYMVMQTNGMLILAKQPEENFYDHKICNNWLGIRYYQDDMKHEMANFTIMKVYGNAKYANQVFRFSTENRELLWERPKKQYTYAQLREILGEEFEVVG